MDILNKKGKKVNSLSAKEIQRKSNLALNQEVVQYKTSLSKLTIVDEDLVSVKYESKNIDMKISPSAYDDILSIGLFNSKIKNTFQRILKDKDKTIHLLNNFRKELITNQGDVPVVLVGNQDSKDIVNIIPEKRGHEIITNSDFLKNAYSIINKYNLTIIDFNVDPLGQIAINTIIDDNNPITIGSLDKNFGTVENETFHRGLHFSSKIGEYKIIPTTVRILCANQITLSQLTDAITFNNLKMVSKAKVYTKLEKLNENNFVPDSFIKQVERAYSTPASLNEFENITNLMLEYSSLEEKDLDSYINYSEMKDTFDSYQNKNGILLNKYMKTQIPTNKTVWELINSMTYMAANGSSSTISESQRDVLKSASGRMLRGDSKNGFFDLQLQLDSPYAKKWY